MVERSGSTWEGGVGGEHLPSTLTGRTTCHDVRTANKFYTMNLTAKQALEHRRLFEQALEHRRLFEQALEHRRLFEQALEHRRLFEQALEGVDLSPSSSSWRKTLTPRRRILLVSSSSSSSSSSASTEAPAQQEESTSDSSQGAAAAATAREETAAPAATTSPLMRLARRGNPTVRLTPLKSCLKRKFFSEQLSPLKVRKVVLTKGATLQGMHRNTKGDRRVKKAIQKRRKVKRVRDKKKQQHKMHRPSTLTGRTTA
ncbi:hypothetical protein DPX16_23683 [Anabarilius grahami]|uniref:Uncharacterized protein n=1 Tax=Anabarilius grahami TaxID=495550 RepID=A0A3N0YGL4_ANAGA|nr:hypothetical protein DPX16_23683 [Anabarilius grahami]